MAITKTDTVVGDLILGVVLGVVGSLVMRGFTGAFGVSLSIWGAVIGLLGLAALLWWPSRRSGDPPVLIWLGLPLGAALGFVFVPNL